MTERRRHKARLRAALLPLVVALPFLASGCGSSGEQEPAPPAATQQVKGTDVVRVVMEEAAVKRIGVRTTPVVRDSRTEGRTVIPARAVLYDPSGAAWAYVSPKENVFQRVDLEVARIDGRSAVLVKGPLVGAAVVTVGATEIWGVEYGGIEED